MAVNSDFQDLQKYAQTGSQDAFSAVVERHLNFVYSVALSQTGNPANAKDITQVVFAALASKAGKLSEGVVLSGWLFRATTFACRNLKREEARRILRDTEAAQHQMNESDSGDTHDIRGLAALIGEALSYLAKADRDAVLLRFFEGEEFRQVGERLGISEAAARMRVNRALEKLRDRLKKQGVPLSSAALGGMLPQFIHAAPASVGAAVKAGSVAAIHSGLSAANKMLLAKVLKAMAYKQASVLIIGATVAVMLVGAVSVVGQYWTQPVVPVIASFSPVSAPPGATVTLTGVNFDTNAADNLVRFGAVLGKVVSASPTNLEVTVPVSATYAPITVTVNGLVASANAPFLPTFRGAGAALSASSFGQRVDLPALYGDGRAIIVDLDGDGKPGLVTMAGVMNGNTLIGFSLFRNICANHSLTTNSFAPRVDIAGNHVAGGISRMVVADLDGDGKPDIVFSDDVKNQLVIFKNQSTPGSLNSNSFAAPFVLATGDKPQGIAIADLDGDGRPDIVVANSGSTTISIFHNVGAKGVLDSHSFAPRVDLTCRTSPNMPVIADLGGDGKPDIAVNNYGSRFLSVFRNLSAPGKLNATSFEPRVDLPSISYANAITVADLEGDGRLDLVVGSYHGHTVSVFHNVGRPGSLTVNSFAPHVDFPLGGRASYIDFGDLTGVGKPDMVVVTELASLMSIFQNQSAPGGFTTASLGRRLDFVGGYNCQGVSVGDLDGDGRPDVVFGNVYDGTVSIFQNQAPLRPVPGVAAAQVPSPLNGERG